MKESHSQTEYVFLASVSSAVCSPELTDELIPQVQARGADQGAQRAVVRAARGQSRPPRGPCLAHSRTCACHSHSDSVLGGSQSEHEQRMNEAMESLKAHFPGTALCLLPLIQSGLVVGLQACVVACSTWLSRPRTRKRCTTARPPCSHPCSCSRLRRYNLAITIALGTQLVLGAFPVRLTSRPLRAGKNLEAVVVDDEKTALECIKVGIELAAWFGEIQAH